MRSIATLFSLKRNVRPRFFARRTSPQQVFNSFWHGGQLSLLEWACLSSFVEHGHKIRLFCYESIDVPPGVIVEDASDIVGSEQVFSAEGGFAAFSDIFRYQLILKYGEWWVDTDVYCLSEKIPQCRYAWAREDTDTINGAILKFPAKDPMLLEISNAATEISKHTTAWCTLGPSVLTQYLDGVQVSGHFGTTESFYPIHWLECFLFWLPDQNDAILQRTRRSCFVHLWTSVFGKFGMDRYFSPPAGSFLHKIYRPHLERFRLKDVDPQKHDHIVETMKAYISRPRVAKRSLRTLGRDVSNFPFDQYLCGRSGLVGG
jgi:hypothetical protein